MDDTTFLNVDRETIFEAHEWPHVSSAIFDMISFGHICEKDFDTVTVAPATARSLYILSNAFSLLEQTSDSAGETEKDGDDNCDITGDSNEARSTYLQGLSLAIAGNEDAEITVIVRTVEAYLGKHGILRQQQMHL